MITFKQFLSEEEQQTLLSLIQRDCAPFLQAVKKKGLLYRGIKKIWKNKSRNIPMSVKSDETNIEFWKKNVRQDRRAMDTFDDLHIDLDNWFNKKFGIKARTQSIFCFADPKDTENYGVPCIVFPIGPIKYVWSPNVPDLFYKIPRNISAKEVPSTMSALKYTDKRLSDMVTTRSEVMIQCDSYYIFPLEYEEQIKKALGFK